MTPIKDLDTDCVMPQKKEIGELESKYNVPPGLTREKEGFNRCVSQNDKLYLVIDEEKMESIVYEEMDKHLKKFNKIRTVVLIAHLKSNVKQWAKIGVKNDSHGIH